MICKLFSLYKEDGIDELIFFFSVIFIVPSVVLFIILELT